MNESRADTSLRISPGMKRLLVIKPSSLGDIVHGLQVVQSVVAARPDLHVSWVVRDRFAGLVRAAPFVDDVIIFRRRDGLPGFWRVLREIRSRRFDVVWDMQGLLRSAIMTAAAPAPQKWGRPDAREGAGFFYTGRVARPEGKGPHHAIDVLRPFGDTLGVHVELQFPLNLKPDEAFSWRKFFDGDPRNTFVIFTDSRGAEKKWPHFPALMESIFAERPGSRIAWCAGKAMEPAFAVPEGRLLNLTGCPLDEMIALVRQPAVFVGNDSGPMHLSAASGNRVLAIFGPTAPERFGPFPLSAAKHRAVAAPEGNLERLPVATVRRVLDELCAAKA